MTRSDNRRNTIKSVPSTCMDLIGFFGSAIIALYDDCQKKEKKSSSIPGQKLFEETES